MNKKSLYLLKLNLLIGFFSLGFLSCGSGISDSDTFKEVALEVLSNENFDSDEISQTLSKTFKRKEKLFKLEEKIKDVSVKLNHIPKELLVLKEFGGKKFSKTEYDSVYNTYGSLVYFDFRFISGERNLYSELNEAYGTSEVLNYFEQSFARSILLDNKHIPSVYHYNLTHGIFPGFSFFIGFDTEILEMSDSLFIQKNLITNSLSLDIKSLLD